MREALRRRRSSSDPEEERIMGGDDQIQYESVSHDEEGIDDEEEASPVEGDNNQSNGRDKGRKRRYRAPPRSMRQGGEIVLGNAKFLLIFLLVTLGAVLIMWQSSVQTSHKKHSHKDSATWLADDDFEDNDDIIIIADDTFEKKSAKGKYPVTYDLSWMQSDWNPYNLQSAEKDQVEWTPPSLPWTAEEGERAFLMQPDVVNRLLVFVSEGDLYVTQYARKTMSKPQAAAKLSTTVGNVRTPRLHPSLPIVAFTATYQGRREVYLQDMRTHSGATRLTYWDDSHGVTNVVGWKDEHTLLISAFHNAVALPDIRLFEIALATDNHHAVLDISPVPLSQAEDAAVKTFATDPGEETECYYFTRMSQPSHTLRYVGGTVQQIWAYCTGYDHAVPLTSEYKGTSKFPSIWQKSNQDYYLMFASDREVGDQHGEWIPGTLNIWAMVLPTPAQLYGKQGFSAPSLVKVTNLECAEQGRTLQEYRVDVPKGNIVLRIGADLFEIASTEVESALDDGAPFSSPKQITVQVLSDFHEIQERLIPFNLLNHLRHVDVLSLPSGQTSALMTIRGQTWMSPILHSSQTRPYQGAGQNMPPRRYRVAPGALTGGSMRIMLSIHVPLYGDDPDIWGRRLALVLATDPLSATSEHAFYLLPIQESAPSTFADLEHAPLPFLGGHVNGGSTKDGGLGSVVKTSVSVSPCGRRLAWADTDGRIAVVTLPLFHQQYNATVKYTLLPDTNELGEPLDGTIADLSWSPGGRYLAITHPAQNKFSIISLADCGDPLDGVINVGRIVQATPSRFNSMSPYWGQSRVDAELEKYNAMLAEATGGPKPENEKSTTLFFLTDRDILNDAGSPWGTRAPMPHFPRRTLLYALPLLSVGTNGVLDPNVPLGRFSGGGAMEVLAAEIQTLTLKIQKILKNETGESGRHLEETSRKLAHEMISRGLSLDSPEVVRILEKDAASNFSSQSLSKDSNYSSSSSSSTPFPEDTDIDFGPKDLTFARSAYRMVNVPESHYYQILAQTEDNGSFILIDLSSGYIPSIKVFSASSYPQDDYKLVPMTVPGESLASWGLSTDRKFIYFAFSPGNMVKVIKNSLADASAAVAELAGGSITTQVADLEDMALSVWPKLEYRQTYNDAWRMLRDYFYDTEMHQVDWEAIHARYSDLVDRCKKREELDDVLGQMAAELSALHVFVYGGEYNSPFGGDAQIIALHQPASFGASLKRSPEWKGFEITEIPQRDPDFNLVTGLPVYSPLSSQSLWQTGQRGLKVGDVIVGVNGESVYKVPDINMLLRGMAGRSVRLEVLRLESGSRSLAEAVVPEPLMVVPLTQEQGSDLRYNAWEYRTRQMAKSLAQDAGFTVGYVHLRAMGSRDVNAFAQGFFEDYNKQALILVGIRDLCIRTLILLNQTNSDVLPPNRTSDTITVATSTPG